MGFLFVIMENVAGDEKSQLMSIRQLRWWLILQNAMW